jgi:hypothetical protein
MLLWSAGVVAAAHELVGTLEQLALAREVLRRLLHVAQAQQHAGLEFRVVRLLLQELLRGALDRLRPRSWSWARAHRGSRG